MKSFVSLLALFLFSSGIFGQVNLNQGLVAYYPFNGNANDQSGNNNNPVFNNAIPTADRYGNPNGAYYFNGSSSYMRIPNSASLNPQRITLSAIVKPMGFYQGPCHGNAILHKTNTGGASDLPGIYRIMFDDGLYTHEGNCSNPIPDTLHSSFYADFAGNSALTQIYSPFVEKDKWYCLTFTFDGSVAKMYINGILVGSKNTNLVYQPNDHDLFIGRLNDALFPYWFNGVIDEIRIYNRALNAEEVNAFCGDCTSVQIIPENGNIKVTGLGSAPIAGIQVFNSNWANVYSQSFTNTSEVSITQLPPGQYFVNVRFYTSNWVPICEKDEYVTIAGNTLPTLSISNVTVNENTGSATLQVCLSSTSSQQVTVQYTTANGSATAGSDYTAGNGTITIPAGQTCASISMAILNDAVPESTENFAVNLSNPTNASIGNGTGTVTINDDDQSQFNCNNITINPGNNLITIGGLTAPVETVQIFNSNWATVFNQTFTNSPGTVNIPIGPGLYHVKVTFYTSGWSFICVTDQDVTVVNQCPAGTICISNICPALSVNLNNAYSIPNLPTGTVVSWHTGTPATDANRLTPAQAQNVATSGSYYAAVNISGANCYSNTIPIIVTITACNGSSTNGSLQVKSTEMNERNRITAFPNPFTHSIRVIIPSIRNEKASVDLIDMFGRPLKVMPVQLMPGSNQILLDGLEKYPSGSYFIRVKFADRIETLKVLRQQ